MKKLRLLLGLTLALMGGVQHATADELTVYDGTTKNQYVPLYGYYADAYQKTEFVFPASDIIAMNGASITGMSFFCEDASKSWGSAVFQVFVKEVSETQLTGFLGTTDATTVYTGSLSVSSSKMEIVFSDSYTYNGGNLLVGIYETTKGSYASTSFYGTSQDGQTAWRGYSTSSLDAVSGTAQYFLPKTTFTYDLPVSGPGLKVKGLDNGDTFAFGMVNAGATKTITLVNPGTEDITVNIATTGGFTADMASATIAANKGEQVVTITAPDETATGTITITPTAEGVDAITINLSCVVKDPSKIFIDFSDNALPEGWETVGVGSYTTGNYSSSYVWDFTNGYALYKSSSSSAGYLDYYYNSLVSPLVKFAEGEKLIFKVRKEASYSTYLGYLRVDYSTDGNTWATAEDGTFADAALTTEWAEKEVTIPATAKKIRFVAAGVALDDIYGGEYSTAPVMKVTASDYVFGMISADAQTTFTIENTGKSELTDVEVTSNDDNFTISGDYASVAVGETATVTVIMSAATKGSHSGVITVTAPDQETVTFNVSGYVMDNELFTETFDGNALPDGWTTTGWTFSNGEAVGDYRSTKYQLITPALVVEDGEKMAIEVQKTRNSGCALDIYVSKDGGDFTKHQTIADADMENGTYKVFFIEGLEAGSYQIRFDANDNKINAVNGFHLNMNAPQMELVSTEAAAFGKVTANASKTYTVKNVGTGELTVIIASDNEAFTVSPAQLVITDEPQDFTVTFNYTEGSYGNYAANITVTPTYNEDAAVTIEASAKAMDPNAWDEDFEEGSMPIGWEADNFTVGTKSYTTNPNSTKLAYASASGATLITPRLQANAGDVLMWEAYFDWYDEGIKVEYSTDEKESWTVLEIDGLTLGTATTGSLADAYVPRYNGFTNERGTKLDMQFVAPADGIYYLRFTSSYSGNGVDNFNGFKLAMKDHDAAITSQNIRSTFTQYADHQVSVTVKELVGKEEELTAKFYIDGTQYGEAVTETVPAGGEKEFVVAVRLNEVISGNAYFVVSNDNLELTSDEVAITTKAAIVIDETVAPEEMPSGYQDKVVVKYTAKQGWNTICLPFALNTDDLTALFGEDYKVYEFKSYTNGELGFGTASRCYAGYPYIVYCESVPTIEEPGYLVTYVSFTASEKNDQYGGATFQGTYSPIAAPGMQGKYGVTPAGKIQKGSDKASLKGYRAYFELPADADPSKLSISFDGEAVATGIDAVEMLNELNGNIYDLQGRKVNHAQKGVYIQNGKKVAIK